MTSRLHSLIKKLKTSNLKLKTVLAFSYLIICRLVPALFIYKKVIQEERSRNVLGLIKEYKLLSNGVKNAKLKSQIRNHMHLCLSRIISVYPYLTMRNPKCQIRNSIFVIQYSIFKKYLGMLLGLFLVVFGFTNVYAQNQIITPEPSSISVGPGSEFSFSVKYDVSDGNNMLTGIGIRIHYNSDILEYVEFSNVFDKGSPNITGTPQDDTENWDNDYDTDKILIIFWSGSNWPGEDLPLTLFDITFKVKQGVGLGVDTFINFTAPDTASGYGFESTPIKVKIEEGANHPPVAEDQSVETYKNTSVDITLKATDEDNDLLTYSIVDNPDHGTLSNFDSDAGTVTYTPDTDYTGSDSFTFKASDGKEDSNVATVSITVVEGEGYQSITPDPISINAGPGDEFTFSVMYDASSNALTGIGFYIHYSSNFLDFIEVSNVFEKGFMGLIGPEDDIDDRDNNPITNKRFLVSWEDLTPPPSWPGSKLPLSLMDITFHVKEWICPPFETSINFTKKDTAQGYAFLSTPMKLHIVSFHLDIDDNGEVEALTDGLLVIRYLFGFRGEDLIDGAIGANANRYDPDEIADWIETGILEEYLDIDDNGAVTSLTDGLLVIRYLFGFRGEDLVIGATGPDGKRTESSEIVEYIEENLMPF